MVIVFAIDVIVLFDCYCILFGVLSEFVLDCLSDVVGLVSFDLC